MPAISKIRFTHVLYEGGNKRYNDETFFFDGHNGAIVLENGGGKTVFIQTALQAMLPHTDLSGRKLKDTLLLENGPAHIAVEWILSDKPRRRYAVTCVSLFLSGNGVDSFRYVYEYGEHDAHGLDHIPYVKAYMNKSRPADKGEIQEYYSSMMQRFPLKARTFDTIKAYKAYLEESYHIIESEWQAIVKINDTEGGIEKFFDDCKTTSQLFDRLLIPTIEQAMEGYEEARFVTMFESHREGFKRYKELKEQIEDNKRIQKELVHYVQLHERLQQAEDRYLGTRREAKAYRHLTLLQHGEQEGEQARLGEREQILHSQHDALNRKWKSLEIAEMEQTKRKEALILREMQDEADGLQERQTKAQYHYHSMHYAEHRTKRELAQLRAAQLEQQLARLEQSEDEQQLQERWERIGGELRTVFERQEKRINATLQAVQTQLADLIQEQSETELTIDHLRKEVRTWELSYRETNTKLEMKKEQRDGITRGILANPALEQVEEQIPVWSARQQRLEEERIAHDSRLKQMAEERASILERQKGNERKRLEIERAKAMYEHQKKQLDNEHTKVLRELAALRSSWEHVPSIYEKEASITERLHDGVSRRQSQKNDLLLQERHAYRFVDDYNGQKQFFADPLIERRLASWKRNFSLLQTGVEYLQSLELDGHELAENKLWAITLVTIESEQGLLMQKLTEAAHELAFPIRVLNTAEAAAILEGAHAKLHDNWAVPVHWQGNLNRAAFEQWKEGLLQHAESIRAKREDVEAQLQHWQHGWQVLSRFLSDYPLSRSQEIEKQLHENREQLVESSREREQLEQNLNQLEELAEKYRKEQERMLDEIHHLGVWLKDAQHYITLGSEMRKLELALIPIHEQLNGLQAQQRKKEYQLHRIQEEREDAENSCGNLRTERQLLLHDDLYQPAQAFVYVDTERSLMELKEAYKMLDREREGLLMARNELERTLRHEQEKAANADQIMISLLREHPDVNQLADLPADLETQKEDWWGRIELYRKQVSEANEKLARQNRQLQKIEGVIETLAGEYGKHFQGEQPVLLTDDLAEVKMGLELEQVKLEKENKELQQRIRYVAGQLLDLDRVRQLWDKHALLHRMDDQRLIAMPIEEQAEMDFAYARMKCSERTISALEAGKQAVEKERELVRKGIQQFKEFCLAHVKDVKLRQMVVQGVEMKQSYTEIVEFGMVMETRIQKALHVMTETIQTHDRELQQFIHRIHMHLKQITSELKELPKKTRIKTADGWREIYSFLIPEWGDQEGKERIREYMEWILAQLEKGRYLDEQGKEMHNDVRKSLEKWLDSKQLLQVVLKSEAMKVSCRKVMNDHHVTKSAFTWEQSNRWSGGEKWSKNMTLFLGLLNYVAEKKHYIQSSMKLHRSVILDNPFGKASSDHVLGPVFFIAEQLGFQILALTAHAEGKFLQDYFPIVYSCRLRHTADSSKQIIESAQQIKHAYFKDNAPESLDRIDARAGQITLF
ncbi:hypothetical protein FHS18_005852 [Paenibacillus phyllosphaerae]|uniref:Chromosome segregation ATPase n=1 Tax=Paenibacillus phyllosphaerae TaxID=274593 RepID=A0A7W5B3Z2_9BACL|nr:chromosome segregation ATPase [Paenibacillus phyllosphaerae]MBB3113739.1 hypothetical protein [Paenibacillus phyllosphaerae]